MWGAINRMGEELQGLAAKENDSESEHEEEASREDAVVETVIPCNLATPVIHNLADPVPLFGIPPTTPTISFRTFDAVSVLDSVRFAMPK